MFLNKFNKIKTAATILIFSILLFHLQGCGTTTQVYDVSLTSKVYDFDSLARSEYVENDEFSSLSKIRRFEYYIQTEATSDSTLIYAITNALKAFRFKIKIQDKNENAIVGTRMPNDLGLGGVTGVYYKSGVNFSEIYIEVKTAYYFTGTIGSRQINWAMDIGKQICRNLQTCINSYPIKTFEQEEVDNWDSIPRSIRNQTIKF